MAKSPSKDAELVTSRREKVATAQAADRRSDQLNRMFYQGHQWAWFDRANNMVRLETDLQDSHRVRATNNQFAPRMNSLLGRMTGKPLTFENRPTAGDDMTVAAAKLAEVVVEDIRREEVWEQVRHENLFNKFTGGTSAIVVGYENQDPGGASIPFGEDVQSQNIVGRSGVRLTPLSFCEFGIEPGSRRWWDARWAIAEVLVPPEQAQAHYGLKKAPSATSYTHTRTPMTGFSTGMPGGQGLTTVTTLYERPNELCDKGMIRVVIDDEVVESTEWTFPWTDQLNMWVFRLSHMPMKWNGWTFLNSARQLQVQYNMLWSVLHEHAKYVANPRLMIPGSVDMDETQLTDQTGEIVRFNSDVPGERPFYLESPSIARWLMDSLDRTEGSLNDVMHTHGPSMGQPQGERASGYALSLVAEKDDTPLSIIGRDEADGWAWLAGAAVQLLEHHDSSTRVAKVEQPYGPPITVEWTGAKLRGQHRFHVPLESTLPMSRAALHAQLESVQQNFPQVFDDMDPQKLTKMLDLPGGHTVFENLMDDNVALAARENNEMAAGNPQVPETWHDHPIHMRQHNRFRNSEAYRNSPQEFRDMVDEHCDAHEAYAMEEVARQTQLNEISPGAAAMPRASEPMGAFAPDPMMGAPQ